MRAAVSPCSSVGEMMMRCAALSTLVWFAALSAMAEETSPIAEEASLRKGRVAYTPADDERDIPLRFRMAKHEFSFQQRKIETVSEKIRIDNVTFPSPVKTPHENNNTVHCEYFRPAGKGQFPGVVVLHILGGDFDLSRLFCRAMADQGVCALFVKMPYYGPRRQPGSPMRMVSINPNESVQGMTQAVLDIRRAGAWLGSRAEVDDDRLGVFGISLGGITAALAATAEPRFKHVCLMLAGGDVATVTWESKELEPIRKRWAAGGGTRESLTEILRKVDPVTYGRNVHGRRILMINARFDKVIPEKCATSLWRSFGEPEIVWLDCGHYTAGRFIFEALARVVRFFQNDENAIPKPAAQRPGATGTTPRK